MQFQGLHLTPSGLLQVNLEEQSPPCTGFASVVWLTTSEVKPSWGGGDTSDLYSCSDDLTFISRRMTENLIAEMV